MKIILYISNFNKIGGVERFVINFYKRIANVIVLYDNGNPEIGERIKWTQKYDCDIFISASAWGRNAQDNINSKIYVQMVHADYRVIISGWEFKYKKHPKTTHHVCVGEIVKEAFEQVTPFKCDAVIHNLLDNNIKYDPKPVNEVLTLITCSRLSGEKGFGRMLKLAQQLDVNNIDYVWNIYGDDSHPSAKTILESFNKSKNVFFKGITTEPFKEINKADYLVQLSDTEGFAYSVYEAMQVKTPCIITPFASGKEQITNGVNGYIVPFDMQNIQFDDILKRDLKVPNFKELGNEKHWINFFNFALNQYYKNMVTVKVIAPAKGFKVGEIVEISKERAELGVKNGLCEIIAKQPKTKKK